MDGTARQDVINSFESHFHKIDDFLNFCERIGGSSKVSMWQFRDQVTKRFSPSDPHFIFHFSAIARIAIEADRRAGRRVFKVGGVPPPVGEILSHEPVVLDASYPVPHTDVPLYRPYKGLLDDLSDITNKLAEISSSRRVSQNAVASSSVPATSGIIASSSKDDRPDDVVKNPPPPSQRSRSPLASRIQPLGAGNARRRERKSRSRVPSLPLPKSPGPFRHSRGPSPQGPPNPRSLQQRVDRRGLPIPNPTAPWPMATPPRSASRNKGKGRRISSPPLPQERKVDSPHTPPFESDPDSSDSELGNPGIVSPPVSRASTSAPLFSKPIRELANTKASPTAISLQQLVVRYKKDIDNCVTLFNSSPNKPSSWPTSLTQDLSEYKVIDLNKLFGEMSSRPSNEVFVFSRKSRKMDVKGTVEPREVENLSDFIQVMEVLRHAYLAAFYSVRHPIKAYFDYISGLIKHSSKVPWEAVKAYDEEVRYEFAQRPSIAWGDYDVPELKISKAETFTTKKKVFSQIPEAPTNLNLKLPLTGIPVNHRIGSPQIGTPETLLIEILARKPRRRQNEIFRLILSKVLLALMIVTSLATIGTLTSVLSPPTHASNNMTFATSWDAMSIIEEAALTDEPNGRRFLRNMEVDSLVDGFSASVDFSLTARPLPSAPPLASDTYAARAIRRRPDIFKIVSPINV
ncbi:uncharacterized protein MELLADRAFT_108223 [Melampsora larici-populina 98AG31]|uniref:Uncharacterized protein n=1 Tax=Melampsora larici-populina (strain 98AG31 / pathotype 3-4-7) TaxID=747676 RepID=F4RSD4_MELLP|nr:uncharacterized protein MELLADRAFT_108223 [Melampsora larici-populina 98AG31]EGG04712.1 hypothetical protein MELLADRAFT_108223 [Melampsora larici-populina 98AG31]